MFGDHKSWWSHGRAFARHINRHRAIVCAPEHVWSRDHTTSLVTAVLPPPGQRCGTVYLNNFGNRTSPLNNSNDCWKRLCLVSWAATPCVWTLRALTRNLTYAWLNVKLDVSVYVLLCSFSIGWLHSTVVERRSFAGELSLFCAWPAANG